MIPNHTKRNLELTAAIMALVYCAVDLLIELIGISTLIEYASYLESYLGPFIVALVVAVVLLITELILAAKLIPNKPSKNKKGLRIAFIVFTSILIIFLFISLFSETISAFTVLGLLLFIAVLVLETVSMKMKDEIPDPAKEEPVATTTETATIEEKVKELKHLLDLGVISQEQYESAVNKAVQKIM